MAVHLKNRDGFGPGRTVITTTEDAEENTGIALAVHRAAAGETITETAGRETAWLLMSGEVEVQAGGQSADWQRGSLFDELPWCLHVSAGTEVIFEFIADTELTLYATENTRPFAPKLYAPHEIRNEPRGKGQVKDTCYRFVRTIFDGTNADPAAELVLGEVITMPGRWSSYPPHHHPQPEIYHYRFTEPQGFGHAELGETVLRVRHNDTVKILDHNDHAQAAAPGYGMYYSWVIRHLPDQRYDVPEFTEEHRWIMEPDAESWWPDNVA